MTIGCNSALLLKSPGRAIMMLAVIKVNISQAYRARLFRALKLESLSGI